MEIPKQQHLYKQLQEISELTDKEAMVRNNIAWMISVADRLLGDRAMAEDTVQEAFISAFRGLEKFQNRSTMRTWLHRITVNTALMKLRQLKRLAEHPIDEYLPEFDKNECRIEAAWQAIPSTEEIISNEQHRSQIHTAINQLPDAYRIVLLLRDIEGYNT
jgi:RNA polymerase sigma-70 factor (ECF subfamily)